MGRGPPPALLYGEEIGRKTGETGGDLCEREGEGGLVHWEVVRERVANSTEKGVERKKATARRKTARQEGRC